MSGDGPEEVFARTEKTLNDTIERVTGDPGELQQTAQACQQAAQQCATAASDHEQIANELAQNWWGQAHDVTHQNMLDTVGQLNDDLKPGLEQEAQRLTGAADALQSAKQKMEQEKQDFQQQKTQIVTTMNQQTQQAIQQAIAANDTSQLQGRIDQIKQLARGQAEALDQREQSAAQQAEQQVDDALAAWDSADSGSAVA